MSPTLQISIDAAGRLVVPEELREKAGIQPGMRLDIRWNEGRLEIEPSPRRLRLETRGSFLVAVPQEPSEALTADLVREVADEIRSRDSS